MIDPDQMQLAKINNNTEVTIDVVPESDYVIWDFEDEKQLKKYFKAVERMVRSSFEYREFISYIKENFDMDRCAFIKSEKGTEFKVEQHHYPFTLYDIVEIVYRKRVYYGELLDVEMVAKEVTMLHYKLIIGLIPLSKTAHQLHHDGKLFIPVDKVLGRYDAFVELYKEFMTTEQLETLSRIESYSENYTDIGTTSVLDANHITIQVNDSRYQPPKLDNLQTNMVNRLIEIKNNNYMLPILGQEEPTQDSLVRSAPLRVDPPKVKNKEIIKPVRFITETLDA